MRNCAILLHVFVDYVSVSCEDLESLRTKSGQTQGTRERAGPGGDHELHRFLPLKTAVMMCRGYTGGRCSEWYSGLPPSGRGWVGASPTSTLSPSVPQAFPIDRLYVTNYSSPDEHTESICIVPQNLCEQNKIDFSQKT